MLISTFGARPAPKEQMVPYSARIFFVERQVAGEIHLDDAVDAGVAHQSENRRCEIVLPAVDNEVGAELVRDVSFLFATRRSDDPRAAPFGELHRVSADPSRTARHIDGFALDRPVGEDRAKTGHGRNSETGAFDKAGIGGQWPHERRGQRDILRRRAHGALEL
jgi:hypothetical protein